MNAEDPIRMALLVEWPDGSTTWMHGGLEGKGISEQPLPPGAVAVRAVQFTEGVEFLGREILPWPA